MRRAFSSQDQADLVRAERDVQARIGDLDVDFRAMAVVANVFRVASAARSRLERTVLAGADLSFTAFTVLWVLWVWGEMESRHLAAEVGVTKGTLTGVVGTLERRGLATRATDGADRRVVRVAPTDDAIDLMQRLFPAFNAEETRIAGVLDDAAQSELAHLLREVLRGLDGIIDLDTSEEAAHG
jgi:DNA-binding MarR family transcriptional regulator